MRIFKEKRRVEKQGKAASFRNRKRSGAVEDYREYHLAVLYKIGCFGIYAVVEGVVSYLFYRSWIAFALLFPFGIFFVRECEKKLGERRRENLEKEFLTGMQAVSTSLSAGYSIENAVEEALKELKKSLDGDSLILREFTWIMGGIHMNRTMEELFGELALRSGVEDIESFAQVFAAARRSGGDLIAIIRNTIQSICQKEETRQEIMVCLAAKRMEQSVMCFMPFFILLYVDLTSPGFLDVLYHNRMGVIVMTGCLAVYLFSWWLGRKIVKIEV